MPVGLLVCHKCKSLLNSRGILWNPFDVLMSSHSPTLSHTFLFGRLLWPNVWLRYQDRAAVDTSWSMPSAAPGSPRPRCFEMWGPPGDGGTPESRPWPLDAIGWLDAKVKVAKVRKSILSLGTSRNISEHLGTSWNISEHLGTRSLHLTSFLSLLHLFSLWNSSTIRDIVFYKVNRQWGKIR